VAIGMLATSIHQITKLSTEEQLWGRQALRTGDAVRMPDETSCVLSGANGANRIPSHPSR
jgi:hypothetical protein